MERFEKLELIQRSLGIRHKIKVHESMKAPETHEELALMMLSKWELEDELRAIEEILADSRLSNVKMKRNSLEKEIDTPPSSDEASKLKKSPKNI